ncbi:hypothetical protein H9636_00160 [Ureibacillus sp. Re31]|uniref:Uncharacterized protein n=1 Tax=Ureibacillus galli TaxID=2762222 RepID=A0ABR8X8C8_9BACL|nr:hypothetical protein [Ureibacillus galli]MBD8025056.1 hypothetical protein [Ureibacillus galli]
MKKYIAFLFKTCLLLFLIGGTCLVFGQLAGLLFQRGEWIVKSWEMFAEPTFMISAIAGIFGFILGYYPKKEVTKVNEVEKSSSNELSEEFELIR